jgi:hypothetical protein
LVKAAGDIIALYVTVRAFRAALKRHKLRYQLQDAARVLERFRAGSRRAEWQWVPHERRPSPELFALEAEHLAILEDA